MRVIGLSLTTLMIACACRPASAPTSGRAVPLGFVVVGDSIYRCPNDPPRVRPGEPPYLASQVELPAMPIAVLSKPALAPARRGERARVTIAFVVDTSGHMEWPSVRLVSSTHALDTQSVCETLPALRFKPATVNGRPVRAWLGMEFRFGD